MTYWYYHGDKSTLNQAEKRLKMDQTEIKLTLTGEIYIHTHTNVEK